MPGGRPRKPSKLKELEGNRAKEGRKRITQDLEAFGDPIQPKQLSASAKKCWSEIMGLVPEGLTKKADSVLLEKVSVALAQFRLASQKIAKEGLVKRSRTHGLIRSPYLLVQSMAAKDLHAGLIELGMTPVARTRLIKQGSARAEDDPLGALMDEFENDPAATRQ